MAKTRKAMKTKQPSVDESLEQEESDVYEVEKIIDKRDSKKGPEYYVKWKNYPQSENTWEPATNIMPTLITDYNKKQVTLAKKNTKKTPAPSRSKSKKAQPIVENEDDDDQNGIEEDAEEDLEAELVPEEEPVKAKRARTAPKKAPVEKQKPQPDNDETSEPQPKEVVKVTAKVLKRTKPKAEQPKKATLVEDKTSDANTTEARKQPNRRNAPVKRASPVKNKDNGSKNGNTTEAITDEKLDQSMIDILGTTQIVEESANVKKDTSVMVTEEIVFSNLKIKSVIDDSVSKKMVTFLGTYNDADTVIRLEKSVFTEDAVKTALEDKKTISERTFVNDKYSSYKIKPSESSSLNSIDVTVVCPADEAVLAKYTRDEAVLYEETPDVYLRVVEPFIKKILAADNDPNRWIFNILEGKSEQERIIFSDPDPDTGFILTSDLRWSGDAKDLHLLAICQRRDIRSLRDLNFKHLALLNNIQNKGTKAIKDKGYEGQIRTYIHYQPSFYHFHVHFKIIEANDYVCSDRDNLLSLVINNIKLKKDYYQKTSLVYPLSKSHLLYPELMSDN